MGPFAWSALLAASIAVMASGQTPNRRGANPDRIARVFFSAVVEEQWLEAAQYVDAGRLERDRQQILRMLRRTTGQPLDLERFELAFARLVDTSEFARLNPLELAARYIEAQDARYNPWQGKRWQASVVGRCTSELAALPRPEYTVRNVFQRGDTAVATYAMTLRAPGLRSVEVRPRELTLVRKAGGWLVVPQDDFLRFFGGTGGRIPPCDSAKRRTGHDSSKPPPLR